MDEGNSPQSCAMQRGAESTADPAKTSNSAVSVIEAMLAFNKEFPRDCLTLGEAM